MSESTLKPSQAPSAPQDAPAAIADRAARPRRTVDLAIPMTHPASTAAGFAARCALGSVLLFAAAATALQFLRSDLDPLAAPLSSYLVGHYGALLRASYYVLGAGVGTLAWAGRAGVPEAPLRDATALLFVLAGLALPPVAITQLYLPDEAARLIHGLCAQTVFLCIATALLLQALAWRRVARFAPFARTRIALAATCLVLLALNLARLPLPRGALQKTLIGLIVVALAWSSATLARKPSMLRSAARIFDC
jgi:hypothetical protein